MRAGMAVLSGDAFSPFQSPKIEAVQRLAAKIGSIKPEPNKQIFERRSRE
jgi:hypothetical protein